MIAGEFGNLDLSESGADVLVDPALIGFVSFVRVIGVEMVDVGAQTLPDRDLAGLGSVCFLEPPEGCR